MRPTLLTADRFALTRRSAVFGGAGALLTACANSRRMSSPFSAGSGFPKLRVPSNACDSHLHILDPRFSATPGWRGEPVSQATVSAYRAVQARIGTTRAVVVTPSTYGVDNRATLDALDQFGDTARGVIVIDSVNPPSDLGLLTARGVRGLRVNFVSPQIWGRSDVERLRSTARIAADWGWHVQVYATGTQIAELAHALASLPAPVVIDHLGAPHPGAADAGAGHRALLDLLAAGRSWVKLSGAYISSRTGPPAYADLRPFARRCVEAAPDRILWGSDWPHRGQSRNLPDDAALLDLLLDWAPTQRDREKILVTNPAELYGFG